MKGGNGRAMPFEGGGPNSWGSSNATYDTERGGTGFGAGLFSDSGRWYLASMSISSLKSLDATSLMLPLW
ncbi:hypothetical protein LY76DRAFT_428098 [Colletotrichum caudatum]|nr:hypothetical protein LY76DRAFT_428098 [Colletotrichum caudatum]